MKAILYSQRNGGPVPRSPTGLCAVAVAEHRRAPAHPPRSRKGKQRRRNSSGEWQEEGVRGRWPLKAGEDRPLPSLPPAQSSSSYRTTQDSGWGAGPVRTPLPNPEEGGSRGAPPTGGGPCAPEGGASGEAFQGFIRSATRHLFFRQERSKL